MDAATHLTQRQSRVLEAFRRRVRQGHPPPTYRELCKEFGWSSTGTARDYIRALVQKGVLRAAAGKALGACLPESSSVTAIMLPVVGDVVAGHPVGAEEYVEGEVPVPEFMAAGEGAFVLRVRGDSMKGAGILDCDLVVVAPDSDPPLDAVVAVTIGGETTLKRLERRGNRLRLVPENSAYAPIDVNTEDVIIHGIAIGLLRALGSGRGRRPVRLRDTARKHMGGRQT